ncbi:hypothetical protein L2E82_10332 [Cichorium intybus]|uniref:Uncharacterized protein n=1 Tax=Cichorium intybus TaxID=13427 RepID=A0ACB9GA56_CICIN|nr:hypothetical protein L2E82_10332 [Cichorium intybus]
MGIRRVAPDDVVPTEGVTQETEGVQLQADDAVPTEGVTQETEGVQLQADDAVPTEVVTQENEGVTQETQGVTVDKQMPMETGMETQGVPMQSHATLLKKVKKEKLEHI